MSSRAGRRPSLLLPGLIGFDGGGGRCCGRSVSLSRARSLRVSLLLVVVVVVLLSLRFVLAAAPRSEARRRAKEVKKK